MIVGVGTDLCDVARIRKSLNRFGNGFASTYCCEREIAYANSRQDKAAEFAKCFAAKEAFAKAVGTGFNDELWWDDIETVFENHVTPRLRVSAKVMTTLEAKHRANFGLKTFLAIGSTKNYCTAFVVIEKNMGGAFERPS